MPKSKSPNKIRYVWHIHHDTLIEAEDDEYGIGERRRYIRHSKPLTEVPLRLALLKRVKHPPKWLDGLREPYSMFMSRAQKRELKALHAKQCPNCPWNGRWEIGSTIFTHFNKKLGIWVKRK